jgi:hypothetical protein
MQLTPENMMLVDDANAYDGGSDNSCVMLRIVN